MTDTVTWQPATLIDSKPVAPNITSLTFRLDDWRPHVCGQYYDIRLTAPDGYHTERPYSVVSTPADEGVVEFAVERLVGGEVSPYLCQMAIGEQVEVRGPLGGHFIWQPVTSTPLILVAGGSGLAPLLSMAREHRRAQAKTDVSILVSAASIDRVPYYDELKALSLADPTVSLSITLTRQAPVDWTGYTRRIDEAMMRQVFGDILSREPTAYICGSTGFVEAASSLLRSAGLSAKQIRTERFGGV